MLWFRNLKVSSKLLLSFTLIILLAAGAGTYMVTNLVRVDRSYAGALDLTGDRIGHIFAAKDHFSRARMAMRDAYNPGNTRQDIVALAGDLDDRLDDLTDELSELYDVASIDVRDMIRTIQPQIETYRADAKYAIGLLLAVEDISLSDPDYRAAMAAAEHKVAEMGVSYANDMAGSIDSLSVLALSMLDDLSAENGNHANNVFYISLVLFAAVASISMVIAVYIPHQISKPLIPLAVFMKKAGTTGNLDLRPEDTETIGKYSRYKDEIGQTISGASAFVRHVTNIAGELHVIADGDLTLELNPLSDEDTMGVSLKNMVGSLNEMFGSIHLASDQVSTGARQIATGAQSLAEGSTQQASSIQQLSSSVAEIAQKTKENAETADRTSKLSKEIKESAETGSCRMEEMISAVREINEASHSISKIIKTIDDIAFQTNILALNAAVEAARAGQHGKGFAVVAEEVRNLAAKSAEAAKETGVMIQNTMEKAEFGSCIAGETASSLSEIVTGINESSKLIDEIAKSSEEQTLGISQINIGIDEVAQVIQQNSATAEQSAAASQEMSSQADALEELLALFKVENSKQKTNLCMIQQIPINPRYLGGGMPAI